MAFTVTILINGQPILTRTAVNVGPARPKRIVPNKIIPCRYLDTIVEPRRG